VSPAVVPVAAATVVEVRAEEEEEDRVEEETREVVATAGVTRAGMAARFPWSTQSCA